jgi:hypothetical protein
MTVTTPKIFDQLLPLNTAAPSILYTVPAGRQAQVTLFVCNQSSGVEYFRIALVKFGQTLIDARYIAWDTAITNNGMFSAAGIGLSSGDSIWVKSATGKLSFTATGIEFS